MGQSAGLIWWEAISHDDVKYASESQPEFHDPYYWAHWLQLLEEHRVALNRCDCEALFTCYFQELELDEVPWRTPAELSAAAQRLKELVISNDEWALELAELYEMLVEDRRRGHPDDGRPPREMFLRESDVVSEMARWATSIGRARLAFEIG